MIFWKKCNIFAQKRSRGVGEGFPKVHPLWRKGASLTWECKVNDKQGPHSAVRLNWLKGGRKVAETAIKQILLQITILSSTQPALIKDFFWTVLVCDKYCLRETLQWKVDGHFQVIWGPGKFGLKKVMVVTLSPHPHIVTFLYRVSLSWGFP